MSFRQKFNLAKLWQRTPLAWLQLKHEKTRLLAAIAGIVFADVLIFMQFGFEGALFDACRKIPKNLQTDLVLLDRKTETIGLRSQPFSRRVLYQAMNYPNIAAGTPLYLANLPWKNPETGGERAIMMIGFAPDEAILNLPEVQNQLAVLRKTDGVLFDRLSRPEFGNVVAPFEDGARVFAEANRRRVEIEGLVTLGASFASDGNIIVSDLNFLRIARRKPEEIDVGLLKLKEGAEINQVKAELERMLPANVRVLTKTELAEFEVNYWAGSTPIGFIFKFGAFFGFIIGVIITYQILYTDVVSHLAEYATLKAMGYTNGYLTNVVFQESLILSILGFLPSLLIAFILYKLASAGANLELNLSAERAAFVFVSTVLMCFVSGLLAIRKLKAADPADIF